MRISDPDIPWVLVPPEMVEQAQKDLHFTVTEKKWGRGPTPTVVTHDIYGYESSSRGVLVPPGYAAQKVPLTPRKVGDLEFPDYPRELRDYQKPAVRTMMNSWVGTLVAPCGAGKTVMGVNLIWQHRMKTLVLVHTLDLKDQWESELEAVLGSGWSDWVRVETFQALMRTEGPIVDYELLLVDECHHVPAKEFLQVLQRIKCWRRYGVTATWEREDGMTPIQEWWVGPVVYEIRPEETGQLRPTVYPLLTEWQFIPKSPQEQDHVHMINALLEDEERNWWIGHAIQMRDVRRPGGSHLVITQRKQHVEDIAHIIHACTGEKVAAITSKLSKKKRKEALERVRSGEIRFLVATQLADEGLDVPIVDTVWLVAPTKSKGRTIQRVGRALRVMEGKDPPMVFDLVDRRIGSLWRQWKTREKVLAQIGEVKNPVSLEEALAA